MFAHIFFWTFCAGMSAGLVGALITGAGFESGSILFCVGIMSLVLGRTVHRNTFVFLLVAVFFSACGVGVVRVAAQTPQISVISQHEKTRYLFEGTVVADPDVRDNAVRALIQVTSYSDATAVYGANERVLALFAAHTPLTYGDTITFTGTVQQPQAFAVNEDHIFDYPRYLEAQGIGALIQYAYIRERTSEDASVASFFIGIKHALHRALASVLPEPQSSLAAGILLGDKHSVGKERSRDFQILGLTHILVLSGYNITIVSDWALRALTVFSMLVKISAVGIIMAFFVIASGGSASAIRAVCMSALALYARESGRIYDAGRALVVVGITMVLWNPRMLFGDPGYQLSVLASAGLIWISPIIAQYLSSVTDRFGLREIVSTTIAVHILVIPYLIVSNGTLSLLGIPANIFVLTLVPWAMASSAIAAIAGVLAGTSAVLVAGPAYVLLESMLAFVQVLASVPHVSLAVSVSRWWVLVYYIIVTLWVLHWHRVTIRVV